MIEVDDAFGRPCLVGTERGIVAALERVDRQHAFDAAERAAYEAHMADWSAGGAQSAIGWIVGLVRRQVDECQLGDGLNRRGGGAGGLHTCLGRRPKPEIRSLCPVTFDRIPVSAV
jgi:hypothetical protein